MRSCLYIIVWLSAWFGVLVTDYLLRRGRYVRHAPVRQHAGSCLVPAPGR